MSMDQHVEQLTRRIEQNPGDLAARHELVTLVLPIALQNWPNDAQKLDLGYFREYLKQVALPIADVADGVRTPEVAEYYFKLFGALSWIGENLAGEEFARRAVSIKDEIAERHPLAAKGVRFFQTRTGIRTQFGHLMSEPDVFLKTGELGWRPRIRGVLTIPDSKCANRSLLRYWKKHICIITDSELCARFEPLAQTLEFNTFWVKTPHIGIRYGHVGFIAAYRQWEREGRPAVLTLDPRQREDGWKILERCGVARDTWFVSSHVRQANSHYNDTVEIRNANIESYFPAYQTIVARGGVVIRQGDASMPRLPRIDGVIDLAHEQGLPDWFDLFLASESRFMLGSASGPIALPSLFGKPVVMANIPALCVPYLREDIFVPKLYRQTHTGRLLTFAESFDARYQFLFNSTVLREHGLEVVDNEPDDLKNATIEMLERLEGVAEYTPEDEYLQSRFNAVVSALDGYPGTCTLARDFARKHRALLTGEPDVGRRGAATPANIPARS